MVKKFAGNEGADYRRLVGMETISVFVVVSQNEKEREDTVVEGVRAALKFADEVICFHQNPKDGTLEELEALKENRVKIINGGTWEKDRFVMGRKKNSALQHCTMDWCMLMDADEVFECKNVKAFKEELKGENVLELHYLHFFTSPKLIKNTKSGFYQWKPSLFRNHVGNFIGGWFIESDTALNKYAQPLAGRHISPELFRVFHYGHCKSNNTVWGKKVNQLLTTYGDDGAGPQDLKDFKVSMDNLEEFNESHPIEMKDRIKNNIMVQLQK